jgi:hypothetical protein
MIRILVLDAYSGGGSMLGKATLQALVSSSSASRSGNAQAAKWEICAAVQDPSQLNIEGVAKQYAIPSDTASANSDDDDNEWSKLFENFHRIFVVTPQIQDVVPFTTTVLQAASKMKNPLELLLVSSDTLVGTNHNSTLKEGQQYQMLEDLVHSNHSLKEKTCLVRIPSSPLWLDYLSVYASQIREHHALMDPRNPDQPFLCVAIVPDVAIACATILTSVGPEQHQQKTYHLVSTSPATLSDLARLLSHKLHMVDRPIGHNRVSYEGTRNGMLGHGMPEWHVDSVLQVFHSIDNTTTSSEEPAFDTGDIEKITGQPPTSLEEWLDQNISQFQ